MFSLPAILAGGLGRAGGGFFGKPLACPGNIASRNDRHHDCERLP